MKIVLCGYMCSGKTSVGKLLAQQMEVPFLDLDQEISQREGKSIPEIFKSPGEIYFRRRESEVLSELLFSPDSFILSLGGGTPCYGNNLETIKESDAQTVYLQTSLEELKRRIMEEKGKRPLLDHLNSSEEIENFLRKHLFERTFYYRQSDGTVNTDGRSKEEIASEIRKKLM